MVDSCFGKIFHLGPYISSWVNPEKEKFIMLCRVLHAESIVLLKDDAIVQSEFYCLLVGAKQEVQ